jgi:hypothetical protein
MDWIFMGSPGYGAHMHVSVFKFTCQSSDDKRLKKAAYATCPTSPLRQLHNSLSFMKKISFSLAVFDF